MFKQQKKDINFLERQDKQQLLCQIHHKNQVIAITTSQVEKNQLKCIQCIIDDNLQGSSLLSLQEIQVSSQHSILGNWPPLKNNSLLQEINQILMNDKQDVFDRIKSYFADFREKFEIKIQQIESQIVQRAQQYLISCSQIIDAYNGISEKEYLQVLFARDGQFNNDFDSINEQIQSLVESKLNVKEKNYEALKKVVDQFISANKIIHFTLPQTFKEEFLNNLQKIEMFSNSIKPSSREKTQYPSEQKQNEQFSQEVVTEFIQNLHKLTQEQINDVNIIVKKMTEINSQIIEEKYILQDNSWGTFRQNSYKIYSTLKNSHFCQESKAVIKKTLLKYPVFDTIQPLMIELHNKLFSSVKLTNQFQLIMSNNQDFQHGRVSTDHEGYQQLEKNEKDGYLISYSNMFLNPKDKYIIKFQIEKNSIHDWIVVGLMPDSVRDKSTLYEQQICYHSGYGDISNQKNLRGRNMQVDYNQAGDIKVFELRICIQDKLFMVTDFPKHENISILNKEPKSPFNDDEKYRFSIALYNPGDKVTLLDVEVVQQFSQL